MSENKIKGTISTKNGSKLDVFLIKNTWKDKPYYIIEWCDNLEELVLDQYGGRTWLGGTRRIVWYKRNNKDNQNFLICEKDKDKWVDLESYSDLSKDKIFYLYWDENKENVIKYEDENLKKLKAHYGGTGENLELRIQLYGQYDNFKDSEDNR